MGSFHTLSQQNEESTMNIFTNSLLKGFKPKTPHPTNHRYIHNPTFSSDGKPNRI